MVQPAIRLESVVTSTTSLSPDQAFWVRVGLPLAGNSNLSVVQNVRVGSGSLTATVTNSNAAVARLTTLAGSAQSRTVTVPEGASASPTSVASGGVAFDPIGAGTTTVAASIPGFIATAATSVNVTVSGPGIQLLSLPTTVGAGLQDGYTARLGATQHGGVTMRIESANPAAVRVAPNATTPGTAFIDVFIPNTQTDASYTIQGIESAPIPSSATITVTATGFTTATGTVDVVQPAIRLESVVTSTTSLSPDQAFWVRVGLPFAGNSNLSVIQNVRVGSGSLTATVTNSNAAVAQLTTLTGSGQSRTVTIPENSSVSPTSVASGGVAFDPIGGRITTVSASIPGFIATARRFSRRHGRPHRRMSAPLVAHNCRRRPAGRLHGSPRRHAAWRRDDAHRELESGRRPRRTECARRPAPRSSTSSFPNTQTDASYTIQGIEGAPDPVLGHHYGHATGFTDRHGYGQRGPAGDSARERRDQHDLALAQSGILGPGRPPARR